MTARCCHIPCDQDADFHIHHGPSFEDYTEACRDHVGHLIPDVAFVTVFPIKVEVPA